MADAPATPPAGAFAPLRHRVFAVLWIATVVGNIGAWMRDTASAWLMTELAPSAIWVAAIQAAATLPVFLLSLPAGAVADIVDRRKLMIGVQAALAVVSLVLAWLAWRDAVTPALLLLLTLCTGVGVAMSNPVWQAIVPQLVPREALRPAVALNSLGINIARAIGPALGGVVIVASGVAMAYLVDVATYAVAILALLWWRPARVERTHAEDFGGALRAGARYAWASRPLRRVLLRATLFFLPATCYWALLPLVASEELSGGAGGYGLLLGALGGGAIVGALLMPRLRQKVATEPLLLGAAFLTAASMVALALSQQVVVALPVLAIAGGAWITTLTLFNATTQGILPDWVRARGLAVYLMVFYGSMALASLAWGQVATVASLDTALVAAAVLLVVLALIGRARPLPSGEEDLRRAVLWPDPVVAVDPDQVSGPVMIQIEYHVPSANCEAFKALALELRQLRLRDGAYDWGLMVDAAQPEQMVEWFMVGSWEEHLRQHDRGTEADRGLLDRVRALHAGDAPPTVRHLMAPARTPRAPLRHDTADDVGH